MFQRSQAIDRTGRITRAATIMKVASPVRQEVLDTIEMLGGTASIGELAEQLGRPADGLYYHVAVLVRAGLLAAAPDGRTRAGRDERRYTIPLAPGRLLAIAYRPRANARAVRKVVSSMLKIAQRDFAAALADESVAVTGDRRELWAGRGTGWVSDRDLVAINRLLRELAGKLRHRRGGDRRRLISACFVLAPLATRPKRRYS
jgi:DNA-binding transcriptional ArsR family regulator